MGGGRRDRLIAGAILLAALAARIGYVLATPGYRTLHDDRAYDQLARGIARTGTYPLVGGHPTAYRPPGFTYLLGAVYAVVGNGHARIVAGRLVQAVLGVVIVALVGAVAARLFGHGLFGRRAGLWAMGLTAVYVPLIAAGTSLLSEPLTVALELGAVLAVLAWRGQGRLAWVVAAGLLGGAMALCRSNGFILLAALAVGVWPSVGPAVSGRPDRGGGLKRVAVLVISAAAVVAPWTIRNAVVMHAFIPVSDELGGTLAGTYNPVSAHDVNGPGFWRLYDQIPPYERATSSLVSGPEPPFQSKLTHLAVQYAEHHPAYVLQVGWHNTLRLLGFNRLSLSEFNASVAGITSPRVADAGVYSFWVISVLALAGLLWRRVRRAIPGFVWLAAGLLFLSIVFVNGEAPRLRLPLDPFVLMVAGAGVAAITTRSRGEAGDQAAGVPDEPALPDEPVRPDGPAPP